jgi:hypothetical protein
MADTIQPIKILSGVWTSLNNESGVAVGDAMIVQNIGMPGDIISLATSSTAPSVDFKGVALDQIKEFLQVTAGESEVWARFYRVDPNENVYSRIGLVQVQVV